MSKKGQPEYNIPDAKEWQKMFAGIGKSKDSKREYYKPNKAGWSKIFGEVDIASSDIEEAEVEGQSTEKKYFARFLSSMSGIMQIVKTEIKPEQRYEVGFKVATNSSAGFLAATVTFVNNARIPVGRPYSIGVKLGTLEPDSCTPVSFVTGPAPKGAVKAQLAFVVFGTETDKVVDIDKPSFKAIS